MSETASNSSGIANRYATALFDIARDGKSIDTLESDVTSLGEALGQSDDLRRMASTPVYGREEKEAAMVAVAGKLGLSDNMTNTLRLMARNGRLFVLDGLVRALHDLIAAEKGEVTAQVTTATALDDKQQDELAKVLKKQVGSDVKLDTHVDETLIGGMIVKVGSKMIDTSIRSKLARLKNSMKEVG